MKGKSPSNSSKNNFYLNNDYSKENVIKIILKNLVDRFSLKNVIIDLVTVTKKNENEILLKDTIPLTCEDILSILYKNIGAIKLYQNLLEISSDENEEKDFSEKKFKQENYIDVQILKSATHLSTIDEDKNSNVVIEINNNEEEEELNDNNNKSNIISINENESSVFEISGTKTELKQKRKREKNKKIKKLEENNYENLQNKVCSESKLVSAPKKLGNKTENKLSYHYVLEKGNMYKFLFEGINEKKQTAKFICDDPNCSAYAEYSIKNKLFKLVKEHNILCDEHCYNKNMILGDMNILNHMIEYNIEDLQLTKV